MIKIVPEPMLMFVSNRAMNKAIKLDAIFIYNATYKPMLHDRTNTPTAKMDMHWKTVIFYRIFIENHSDIFSVDVEVHPNGLLIIRNAQASDSGRYR